MAVLRRVAFPLLLVGALATFVAPIGGQASSFGQWSSVFTMPLVTVHAALMNTGKLLLFDAWEIPGTPSATLWDPLTNQYTAVPNGFAELFCAGHFLSSDGRLFTTGGHNGAGVGTTDTTTFDPLTLQWTALPDMSYARWYPTVSQLADGRFLTAGGTISGPAVAEIPEIIANGGASWTSLPVAQKDIGEYPALFQAPGGSLFVAAYAPDFRTWYLNPNTSAWTLIGTSPAPSGVAVMYRPGKVLMTGGGIDRGADPVTTNTGVIDLNSASPTWRQVGSTAYGRSQHNLVILPDGKVMVVGGAGDVSLESTQPVFPAEIWDPNTESWTTMAAMVTPRIYHSVALLLPDGRVLASGGGRLPPNQFSGEFYSPPYLFQGTRPIVSSAPTTVGYGATFSVSSPDAASIARVTLVRNSSVTHTVNADQRFLELSFTAGAGTLNVQAPNDSIAAPAGHYMLFALNANGVPSLGRIVKLGGAVGPPTLAISDVAVNEGGPATGASAVFTVTLSGLASSTVTVNYATSSGTAISGSDFTATTGSLSFPPGTAARTITVPIVGDTDVESNETFSMTLSSVVNATITRAVGTGTIVNDDSPPIPSLSINSVSVVEGSGSGTPVASFTVSLSFAAAQNVLVSYRTVAGTATAGSDYTHTTGTLTFAGGTTQQTIQVPVVPDAVIEPSEAFAVELYNPVQATIATPTGTATIVDDDAGTVTATFVVAAGADDVNEDGADFDTALNPPWLGNGGSATASYLGLRFTGVSIPAGATVSSAHLEVNSSSSQWNGLTFEMGAEAVANSAPFGATARPSQRALLAPRVIHASNTQWGAGAWVALDDIRTVVQAVVSQPGWVGNQAVSVILRGTGGSWARKYVMGAEGGAATAARLVVAYTVGGTAQPTLAVSDTTVTEGNSGSPVATFTATLSAPAVTPVTVSYGTANGTAVAPGDYTTTTGTLTFSGATTTQTVSVPVVPDLVAEANETFTLTLTNPVNATLADGVGVGTIVDDDAASLPTLAIGNVTVTEGSSGAPVASFTVTLSTPAVTPVTVSYGTANGTAVAPGDYTTTTGTLTFSGATTTQTVSVPVVPDLVAEANETFTVTLTGATNATIAVPTGTATIVDDDAGTVTATFVVAAGADDVNEDGAFKAGGNTVWMGNGSSTTASYLGLRFTGVAIPAGATVTSAHLEVTALTTQWTPQAFETGAEASANSAAFTASSKPSQRTLLVPRVAHSSNAQWVAGTRYSLEDISTVVQAVVQQPGWASGQALALVLRGTGAKWGRKQVASAENGPATAPRIVVTYSMTGLP